MRGRAFALALLVSLPALADEESTAVTGFRACEDLEAKNKKELAMWMAAQPPKPSTYPEREAILDAPWIELGRAFGHTAALLAATLVPHVGVGFRSNQPEFVLTWPLGVSVGPALSCSRKTGTFEIDRSRPNRFLLEPAIWTADAGATFSIRPGYRFVHHPTDVLFGFFGFGVGIGSTIEIARPRAVAPGNSAPRASISPEVIIRLGSCCSPGYVTIASRFDFFFDGPQTPVGFSTTMGFTYF